MNNLIILLYIITAFLFLMMIFAVVMTVYTAIVQSKQEGAFRNNLKIGQDTPLGTVKYINGDVVTLSRKDITVDMDMIFPLKYDKGKYPFLYALKYKP